MCQSLNCLLCHYSHLRYSAILWIFVIVGTGNNHHGINRLNYKETVVTPIVTLHEDYLMYSPCQLLGFTLMVRLITVIFPCSTVSFGEWRHDGKVSKVRNSIFNEHLIVSIIEIVRTGGNLSSDDEIFYQLSK